MSAPSTVDLALILPQVPEITTDYDFANLVDVGSPDANCVKNIRVVLAGFDDITDDFMERNYAAWNAEGETWPDADIYKLDGMALYFELEISDTNAVAVCVQ